MELGLLDGKMELFGTVIGQVGFVVKISNTQLNPFTNTIFYIVMFVVDSEPM
jgi:hypothetical protein